MNRIAEKFCSHPILSLAVLAGLIAAEWVIWKTTHVAIALLAAGVLTLLFLPLLRQMRQFRHIAQFWHTVLCVSEKFIENAIFQAFLKKMLAIGTPP